MGTPLPVPGGTPVIVLRVTVRANDLESFVTRYSRHLHGDRIFIFTKNPQPIGTRVRFMLQLQSGEQLLHGKGTVTRVQEEEGDRRHPPGMELVFVALDDRSQTLVDFMRATRADEEPPIARALAPVPPPIPRRAEAQTPLSAEEPEAPTLVSPELPRATPPAAPKPAPSLERPSSLAIKLLQHVPPLTSAQVVPGPAPVFAEKWRDPLPPGAPAAGTEHTLAANPLTEVPDSAIDYFVEWSLEQSIGPRAEKSSTFSDVAMSLPGMQGGDDAPGAARAEPSRRLRAVGAIAFAVGGLVGVGSTLALRPAPSHGRAERVAAAPPVPASPAPVSAAAPKPAAAASAPAQVAAGELSVATRPPGAKVSLDGKPIGSSPVTAHLPAGTHELSIMKERYAVIETRVDGPGRLAFDLKRPPATLHVDSTPAGADVKIAGVAHGRTPTSLKLPAFESYDVQVTLAGGRPWRKSVYLRSTSNQVQATLTAPPKPAKPAAKLGQRVNARE